MQSKLQGCFRPVLFTEMPSRCLWVAGHEIVVRDTDFPQHLAGCIGPRVGSDHKELPELTAQTRTPLSTMHVDTCNPTVGAEVQLSRCGKIHCARLRIPPLSLAHHRPPGTASNTRSPRQCVGLRGANAAPLRLRWAERHQRRSGQ